MLRADGRGSKRLVLVRIAPWSLEQLNFCNRTMDLESCRKQIAPSGSRKTNVLGQWECKIMFHFYRKKIGIKKKNAPVSFPCFILNEKNDSTVCILTVLQ